MAHPIRPEKYAAIDNFYTSTVYEKGAEVIRMYETLLGRDGFRKGMDLYFQRHDGQAVTCDDFRAAMADANGRDLAQFERWYLHAGTPVVIAEGVWNPVDGVYTLKLTQRIPDTPGQTTKLPMHIPVIVGLLDRTSGQEVIGNTVLELTKENQVFEFQVPTGLCLQDSPVPSILRNFSAPVVLEHPYTDDELALLAGSDTDSFNRWDAMQRLGTKAILNAYETQDLSAWKPAAAFVKAMRRTILDQTTEDLSLLAYALSLPTYATLLEVLQPPVDPLRLHSARAHVRQVLANALRSELHQRYIELTPRLGDEYVVDGLNSSRRRLWHVCLGYLVAEHDEHAMELCWQHFAKAGGMTEKAAALGHLCDFPLGTSCRDRALDRFLGEAAGDANVVDKWFAMQARADADDLLLRVESLVKHPEFTMKNPNRLRSVLGPYFRSPHFHDAIGKGYDFASRIIAEVDAINPQIAARLAGVAFQPWRRLDVSRQTLIKQQLDMLITLDLSKDVLEIIAKTRGV